MIGETNVAVKRVPEALSTCINTAASLDAHTCRRADGPTVVCAALSTNRLCKTVWHGRRNNDAEYKYLLSARSPVIPGVFDRFFHRGVSACRCHNVLPSYGDLDRLVTQLHAGTSARRGPRGIPRPTQTIAVHVRDLYIGGQIDQLRAVSHGELLSMRSDHCNGFVRGYSLQIRPVHTSLPRPACTASVRPSVRLSSVPELLSDRRLLAPAIGQAAWKTRKDRRCGSDERRAKCRTRVSICTCERANGEMLFTIFGTGLTAALTAESVRCERQTGTEMNACWSAVNGR
jgi:hypothetical protein